MLRQITLADVNRVAKKYFNLSHVIVGALTPSLNGSSAPPAAGRTKDSPVGDRATTTALPEWAKFLVKTVVPSAISAPTDMRLPNGIRLIVQPENVSHSVVVRGAIANNATLQEPAGKEGVGAVLDRLFSYGSSTHDRTEYQRLLDSVGANEDGGTAFAVQGTSDVFERSVALLAENELHPRFEAREFAIARDSAAQSVESTQNGSHTIGVRRLRERLLPVSDPALREPTPRSIMQLSLTDARAYYQSVFRPDLTTIVVVGDVTPARARAVVEREFGGWQANGPAPKLDLPPSPLNAPANVSVSPPALRQDIVTLEQTLNVVRDTPDYYALTVGNAAFGGGSGGAQQSMLFRDLRQNSGLVYYVNSRLDVGRTRGTLGIDFACAPDNLARAQAIVVADINKLSSVPLDEDVLAITKASLVRHAIVSAADANAIGSDLLGRAIGDRPLDADRRAAEGYLATTPAALQAAFKKYVRPDGFVRLIEGPVAP